MCDEFTRRDIERLRSEPQLGRRAFTGLFVGTTAALLVPGCASDSNPSEERVAGTTSNLVMIDTPDGTADAFFVHPESGTHPAILVWPDILGLRDAFKMMAIRLAGRGYAVLVINQYYRTSPAPVLSSWDEWMSDEGKAKLQPNLAAITSDGISRDGGALVDWLDKQSAVDTRKKLGTSGYCMGGPFTFRTAASRPERVGAVASFHGANLVSDAPDSPHLLIPELKASLLIAIAENDDMRQPDAKATLEDAAAAANLSAEIEVYPAQHGWCPPDSPVYDEVQAERAWSRMHALFGVL
jgi:carboxymethylenebutenolidase